MGEQSDTARRNIDEVAREHHESRQRTGLTNQTFAEVREAVRKAVVAEEQSKK